MGSIQAILSYNNDHSTLLSVNGRNEIRSLGLAEKIWRWIESIFIGREAAFSDCRAEKVAFAIQMMVDQKQLDVRHLWSCADCLQSLETRVGRAVAKRAIQITAKSCRIAASKPRKKLVKMAISHLQKNHEPTPAHNTALRFLYKCKGALSEGRRIALPYWFHATNDERKLTSILDSQAIKQNNAIRGYGAYVSSSDEAGQVIGYGRYTFALDDEAVTPHHAAYFVPNPETGLIGWGFNRLLGWKCASIWVRVHSSLSIQEKTVAYVTYPTEEEHTHRARRVSISQNYRWITWIDRDASNKITEVFRTVMKREIPGHWSQLQPTNPRDLPDHFQSK